MSRTNAVYNSEPKASLTYCALTGGLAGYAVKHMLPLSDQERVAYDQERYMNNQKPAIAYQRKTFVDEIRAKSAAEPDNKLFKWFLKIVDERKTANVKDIFASDEFKAESSEVRKNTKSLYNQFIGMIDNAKNVSNYSFESIVKNNRSNLLFAGVGALTGVALAFAWNSLNANGERIRREYAESRDFDELA